MRVEACIPQIKLGGLLNVDKSGGDQNPVYNIAKTVMVRISCETQLLNFNEINVVWVWSNVLKYLVNQNTWT